MTRTRTSCPRDTGCEGTFTLTGVDGHGDRRERLHGHHGGLHRQGRRAGRPVTGHRRGDPPAEAQAGRVLATTGRTADSRATTGDPGVADEATTDVGGGNSAAFIEDGDWISFNPYNLEDLEQGHVPRRLGRRGRHDRARATTTPDGPLVAATPNIAPTGGWQTWTDVTIDLPANVPEGTHRLFVVFRHPTGHRSLMNLNWFKFAGKGAAITAPPEVTADGGAHDRRGAARRSRSTSTATDPEGDGADVRRGTSASPARRPTPRPRPTRPTRTSGRATTRRP